MVEDRSRHSTFFSLHYCFVVLSLSVIISMSLVSIIVLMFSFLCLMKYEYCFFLLQEEILARIDVSLSLFPKVIFQRLLTHVYSISNRVFPWEAGFLIFDSEENLILCEVNHGNSCSSLTLRGRHKKDNFRQIWKSLIDMFQVFSVCSFHFHSF